MEPEFVLYPQKLELYEC